MCFGQMLKTASRTPFVRVVLLTLCCVPSIAIADLQSANSARPTVSLAESEESDRNVAIEEGFVIADGRYLPPPYTLDEKEGELLVNGISLGTDLLTSHFRRKGRPGGRRGRGGPHGRTDSPQAVAERTLLNNGLIIRFDDGSATIVYNPYAVLETLTGPEETSVKLKALMNTGRRFVTLKHWASLLETFEPTEELSERVIAMKPEAVAAVAVAQENIQSRLYVLNIVGMALTALAFGIVLKYRPTSGHRWRDVNEDIRSIQLVWNCAGLILLLSVFDLVCTLLFSSTAGFWELNPLGASMVSQPPLLIAFKLTATLVSVSILLGIRKYRGAQVTSWWLSLALALLTARWTAFSSLMLN